MFKIKIKTFFSIILSKFVIIVSKYVFKGGTNFPGKVALKIDKNILKTVGQGYYTIVVTGTNGKTTTTSMICNTLRDSGKKVITNSSGANMLSGIICCFVENFKFKNKDEQKYAVIEVDEANLTLFTDFMNPQIITVTNLFRDQLDRYGEVYTTLKKIISGIEKSPDSLLLFNGDESLLGDIKLKNKVFYYGFNCSTNDSKKVDVNADAKFCKKCKAPYKYNFITYNHLGDFYCENCGYKRPFLNFSVDKIIDVSSEGSHVIINGNEFYINQPGIYNIYNGLCAYSIAKYLNIDNSVIFNSLKSQESSFGRQEILKIEDKEVKIILVKNPAGYNEAINTITLDKKNITLAALLNDNYADGRDVSWIWDVNFEEFKKLNIKKVIASGNRLYDMAVRLKIAGLDESKFSLCQNFDELLEEIKNCPTSAVYILATYTAMTSLRKYLKEKKYIKKLW